MAYTSVKKAGSQGLFNNMANPIIRKMEKNAEYDASRTASYSGIVGKTVFFLWATVMGAILCFVVHNILTGSAGSAELLHVADAKNGIYDFTMARTEGIILMAVLAISLVFPFVSWFFRRTIPVTGTVYCVAQGYLIGFITVALAPGYKFVSVLAMLITTALVGAMLFVYAKGIIKVTEKFKGVITAAFIGVILAGIAFMILSIILAVRGSELFMGISGAMNNPVVSILLSVVLVVLASLFMLADFDTIEKCVQNKVDKKYEWMAAWGLAYTTCLYDPLHLL